MKILGISGYAKSGKDTVAANLQGYRRVAFADSLKYEIATGLGCGYGDFLEMLSDPTYKEKVRPLMVEWGRFRRAIDQDYWIKTLANNVNGIVRLLGDKGGLVVTDVRYANEAAWIRGLGGYVIGVERPGVGPANEEECRSFLAFTPDYTILNDQTIESLATKAAEVVAEIERRWNDGDKAKS